MSPEIVALVESLAKRWMLGTRDGSDRPSWKHPEDLVALLRQMPGIRATLTTQFTLEAVAWGHDLLEDGVTEDGSKVTEETLSKAGVPDEVIVCIRLLSKEPWMEPWMIKPWYARQVMGAPDVVRIVKCVDRIANLTEARGTFKPQRWARYVAETNEWILPMAKELEGPHGAWLVSQLEVLVSGGQS